MLSIFRKFLHRFLGQEDINFLLTNRLPRRYLTLTIGWVSKIENPLVRGLCMGAWKFFGDLDLSDAKETTFRSMHDCFTRQLRDGARPIDPDPDALCSPSDGIIGAHGRIQEGQLFQAKGYPYTLQELLGADAQNPAWTSGTFVTLRLTSGMYHRFHAPQDCVVQQVRYFSGDTWNVNPIALQRVERLFCKNERAFLKTSIQGDGPLSGMPIALVPVAAILVASIRLHFLNVLLHLRYRGPNTIECNASLKKEEEMGWFQHGSTIILLTPASLQLAPGLTLGSRVRMGQVLMRLSTQST